MGNVRAFNKADGTITVFGPDGKIVTNIGGAGLPSTDPALVIFPPVTELTDGENLFEITDEEDLELAFDTLDFYGIVNGEDAGDIRALYALGIDADMDHPGVGAFEGCMADFLGGWDATEGLRSDSPEYVEAKISLGMLLERFPVRLQMAIIDELERADGLPFGFFRN